MSSSSELSPLLRLAAPLMLVNVGNKLMGTVDTILAGQLGSVAIGAVGMGADMFFTGSIIAFGILVGIDPLVAQAFGAGRARRARRTMWHGVYVAVMLCVPLTFGVLGLAHSLEKFGVDGELASQTRVYVYGRLPSLLPLLAFVAGRTYLQAAQVTRPIVIAMVVANVFNLGAALALMPRFGVAGLAWAASMATCLELVVLVVALRRLDPGAGEEPLRALDARLLRTLFAVGLPLGFQYLAEIGIFVLAGVLMAGFSATAAAAHHVAIALASLTFMVPMALAAATSVRVGRAIGAGDAAAMRRAGLVGIQVGAAFMLACGVVMMVAAEPLARLWTTDASVLPLATVLIRIAATFQIFDGIQVVAQGALRGAGMTRWSLAVCLVAYWLVALPAALVLAYGLKLGPTGLWWGLTIGLAAASVALTARFVQVSRRPIAALEPSSSAA